MHSKYLPIDAQQFSRLKNNIIQQAPSKPLIDFLNYLQQNIKQPNCFAKILPCFTAKQTFNVSWEFREAYEGMTESERKEYYGKVLIISEVALNRKAVLVTSMLQIEDISPPEEVEMLVRSSRGREWMKQKAWINFNAKTIQTPRYSLPFGDFFLKKDKDLYLTRAKLVPLLQGLPHLQLILPQQLFQRLEEGLDDSLLERIVRMIEGQDEQHITQHEEEVNSERHLIHDKPQNSFTFGKVDKSCNQEKGGDYLSFRHPVEPYPKTACNLLIPKGSIHYFFEGEFELGKDGELVVCNQTKLEQQSNVIKYVIKRVLTGTKVFSISLPVQVFSSQSNLSLLLSSFRYAPLILEPAVLMPPLERFKQVIKFSLTCPACYIRCDKPFNPLLGETYQTIVDGVIFNGQQVSHHPPISSAFIKGRGFTLYGSFQAEVQFGFNSAVGNNKGWVKVSFDPLDLSKKVVRFTNGPGQMSGLIFGKRTLNLVDSAYYVDEENYLFCQLFFGKVNLQPGTKARRDSVEGRVVQLKRNSNLYKVSELKESDVERCIGLIRGEWLGNVFFNNELLLNTRKENPPAVEKYPGVLPSDYSLREDIVLRHCGGTDECQAAKEKLEDIQRRDRKLREAKKEGIQ